MAMTGQAALRHAASWTAISSKPGVISSPRGRTAATARAFTEAAPGARGQGSLAPVRAEGSDLTVTVSDGDTLWALGARHLPPLGLRGGLRASEIWKLNQGRVLSDRTGATRVFTNKDLIFAGEVLVMPADAVGCSPAPAAPASSDEPTHRSPGRNRRRERAGSRPGASCGCAIAAGVVGQAAFGDNHRPSGKPDGASCGWLIGDGAAALLPTPAHSPATKAGAGTGGPRGVAAGQSPAQAKR